MPQLIIVYHVFQVERWEQLFCEQIGAMYASGLLSHARLIIGVNGNEPLPLTLDCEVVRHENGFSEKPSLLLAKAMASANPDAYILYCHTKGISHPTRNQDDWRMMMQHFLIVNWQRAISYLEEYDLATVNWRTFPLPHPSGNFWWARAGYLLGLNEDYLNDFDRMPQEFWTGSQPCRVANLHETEADHYNMQCLPSSYSPGYFAERDDTNHCLSYSSRADAIAQGILAPAGMVDFF